MDPFSPIIRIPTGLVIMVAGFWMVLRTNTVMEWFGRVDWAEDKLGAGGSWTFYKLVGVIVVFVGIMTATNVITGVLEDITGLFVR